jgi:hypothetical protein
LRLRVYRGGCSFGTGLSPDSPELTPLAIPSRQSLSSEKNATVCNRFAADRRHFTPRLCQKQQLPATIQRNFVLPKAVLTDIKDRPPQI